MTQKPKGSNDNYQQKEKKTKKALDRNQLTGVTWRDSAHTAREHTNKRKFR